MGSRENFNIFISNIGGNYAVALQNGEIREFFLQRSNNFLGKFFASSGINCNYSFSRAAETFPPLRSSAATGQTLGDIARTYNGGSIEPVSLLAENSPNGILA
jgi:hypothetical protein